MKIPMHVPIADIVLGPISAGFFADPAMILVAWLSRCVTPSHWRSIVARSQTHALIVLVWLASVMIYALFLPPRDRAAELGGMGVCDGFIFLLFAAMAAFSLRRRPDNPGA